MKLQTSIIVALILVFVLNVNGQNKESEFDGIKKSKQWHLVLKDKCTKDWTKNWFMDGLLSTVKNTKQGMLFSAGSEVRNDAHHAVLWTKESYAGDVKIEFDYTRTDTDNRWVNILYVQATGDGEGPYEKDITKWNKLREVPAMKTYYENMNAIHISFAAYGNAGDGTYYVRARRYPKPNNKSFDVTKIVPSYDQHGYFKTGQTYHITAIKSGKQLFFKMESKDGEELFSWDLSGVEPITEGRIGLRHMYARSAIYRNFKIYTK